MNWFTILCGMDEHEQCYEGQCACNCHQNLEIRGLKNVSDLEHVVRAVGYEVWVDQVDEGYIEPMVRFAVAQVSVEATIAELAAMVKAVLIARGKDYWAERETVGDYRSLKATL